ncbi:hypothetical protein IPA_01695 [Ignicoccus pacificus DSM 13166]|uniref:Uncharacterized protein n=1 Tax=Ignicoccus pacificus DSM 13166 TaxID=940294 RepID=A0A977KA27_9CREN|nr:hypothetical protein IPA_01695 [Ignicoccus pacificus DSM 13166]
MALSKPIPKDITEELFRYRLEQAEEEVKLAKRLLKEGFIRNAAGKAFQAWKELLGAYIVKHYEDLKGFYSEEKLKKLALLVPTTKMKEISNKLAQVGERELTAWTDKALSLHRFQYNGPDPDLALSDYRSEEEAREDIEILIGEIERRVRELRKG